MRLTDEFYTPSYLLCLKDVILPYHLLKYCLEAYRNKYEGDDDPFLNPIIAHDNILKHLPPVRIITGSADPLRDDAIRFLKRLT
jgi:hormone-sensitive lipase